MDITIFSMEIAIEGLHHFKVVVNWVGIPISWGQSANVDEGNYLI